MPWTAQGKNAGEWSVLDISGALSLSVVTNFAYFICWSSM